MAGDEQGSYGPDDGRWRGANVGGGRGRDRGARVGGGLARRARRLPGGRLLGGFGGFQWAVEDGSGPLGG